MAEVSIAEQLKTLIELQKLDGKIFGLRQEKEAKPIEAERLKSEYQQAVEQEKAEEGSYKSHEVKRKDMENDLADKETQIKKLQGQLFQVKTNKEYSAMQKEIEGFKADKSVLEEEILKLMEESDTAKAHINTDREKLKQQETELNTKLSQLEAEGKKIDSELAALEASRNELVPKVDAKILAQYERILKRKAGSALVAVLGDACGGCHIALPPQTINEIQLATRLIPCESCGRILCIEPSE